MNDRAGAPLLEVNKLTKYFGGLAAIRDVSFEVRQGQIFGFIGPNGAGKTTLFSVIAGAARPTSGTVRRSGRDITGLRSFELVKAGIARTHQVARPFRAMTVLENVQVAVHFGRHGGRGPQRARLKPALSEVEGLAGVVGGGPEPATKKAMDVLRAVGLEKLADTPAFVLSVGHQKKLEVARALATGPDLLLCDEICGGLTHAETAAMLQLLREIRRQGTTIMYVEHDVKAITAVCDRIMVLNYGRKLAEGTPAEIQNDPAVIEAYLGERKSSDGR